MKAVEFEGELASGGNIRIPPEVACELPAGSKVRVMLLWEDNEGVDSRWNSLERFAAAYTPEDSVYEQLIHLS